MTSNNQTKEQEIRERFDKKFSVMYSSQKGSFFHKKVLSYFFEPKNATPNDIKDFWLKELHSALQEQKEKIIEEIKWHDKDGYIGEWTETIINSIKNL